MALPASMLAILPPWLMQHPALAEQWVDAFVNAGGDAAGEYSSKTATSAVRQSGAYQQIFPAMFDEEGNMRFLSDPEASYQRTMESYRNTLRSFNVNPDVFGDRLHNLIEGQVSAGEFVQRTEAIYENVVESAPAIRNWYLENFAKEMTDEAIFASFIDGEGGPVSQAILEDRISMAQIGGEAEMRGFTVGLDFVDQLEDTGMTRAGAQNFFGQAASLLPTLSALASRHADPDDDFDLNEFTKATIFDDPEQRRRMRRLVAQEKSTFTGGAGIDIVRTQRGTTGLIDI